MRIAAEIPMVQFVPTAGGHEKHCYWKITHGYGSGVLLNEMTKFTDEEKVQRVGCTVVLQICRRAVRCGAWRLRDSTPFFSGIQLLGCGNFRDSTPWLLDFQIKSENLSVCPSVCPSVCLSISQSVRLLVFLSVCLSFCLSVCGCLVCQSVVLSVCRSVSLSVCRDCLSDCASVCQSICPSICLSLSVCLCL